MLNPDNVRRATVISWSNQALRSVIASTNPDGIYRDQVRWAKEELNRRNIDFSDCLSA